MTRENPLFAANTNCGCNVYEMALLGPRTKDIYASRPSLRVDNS